MPLGLLALGDKADGMITEVRGSNVNTEMKNGRRSINKPSGLFTVKTKVRYRFDVHPTPLEELKRLSAEPLATNVTGCDTLYGKTRFPDVPMHVKGDKLRVIFLKPFPSMNAAYQPNTRSTYGFLRLIGGVSLFVWGLLISLRQKKKRPETGIEVLNQIENEHDTKSKGV
jgi:hypothetical protein